MLKRYQVSKWRQRGSAAVEFALLLPIFLALLIAPLMLGIFQYHYTAVVKASHDAARYMSTLTQQDMREPVLAEAANAIAREIVAIELGELIPVGPITVEIFCGNNRLCGGVRSGALPEFVTVRIELYIVDRFFGFFDTGRYGWSVDYETSVRYVGS